MTILSWNTIWLIFCVFFFKLKVPFKLSFFHRKKHKKNRWNLWKTKNDTIGYIATFDEYRSRRWIIADNRAKKFTCIRFFERWLKILNLFTVLCWQLLYTMTLWSRYLDMEIWSVLTSDSKKKLDAVIKRYSKRMAINRVPVYVSIHKIYTHVR